jgi:transcriptional regulator with XRE-family HTH domain
MDVREATELALQQKYGLGHVTAPPVAQLRTPVDRPAGQKSRIGQLVTLFKGDRKQVAAAIGVTRDTLTRWLGGKQTISKANQEKLERAYQKNIIKPKQERADARARKAAAAGVSPDQHAQVKVSATIRWSKSTKKQYNNRPYRTTTLDNIDLSPVVRAWLRGTDVGTALEKAITDQYSIKDGIGLEGNSVEIEFL